MTQDQASAGGERPEFESDEHAEWRIRNGGVIVLRLDRKTGTWAGEWERLDPGSRDHREPHTISPEQAQDIARSRDLRFGDGTRVG
jgi:hypothetical protein